MPSTFYWQAVSGGEWRELGTTTDDLHFGYAVQPPYSEAVDYLAVSRTASRSFRVNQVSAATFWALFRRRHPRIKALRSAYRRRHR